MKLLTPIGFSLCLTLLSVLAYSHTASAQGKYYGIENRYTYTEWHEYRYQASDIWYDENFTLTGIKAGFFFSKSEVDPVNIYYGADISVHPIGSYKTSTDGSNSAFGVRASVLAHIDYSLNNDLSLVARPGLAFLAAVGSGDDTYHEESFGSYLPTIDLGIGFRWKGFNYLGADALSVFYTASLVNLGMWTDNWVYETPNNADWNNFSISITVDFGY